MVIKQAVAVIGEALALGSKQGAYGIGDSALIKTAYDSLTNYVEMNEDSAKNEEPVTQEKEVEETDK